MSFSQFLVARAGLLPIVRSGSPVNGRPQFASRNNHRNPHLRSASELQFFVNGPAGDLTGVRRIAGGLVDVGPTLLELLGIDTSASFAGHSLLADRPALAVRVDEVVMDGERIFAPSGRQIPQGGACFNYPQGDMRPAADCEASKREGYVEASASIFLANHDLARQVLESSR